MLRIAFSCLLLIMLLSPTMAAAEVTITGIDKELERNIRSFAAIASEPCDAEDWVIRRRFRTIVVRVAQNLTGRKPRKGKQVSEGRIR